MLLDKPSAYHGTTTEMSSCFNWGLILSSPSLSHLATAIFLALDLDTFNVLEQVCNAWKKHVDENNLWRQKLLKTIAKPRTFALESLEEAQARSLDPDLVSGLCRTLCLGHMWFGPEDRIGYFRQLIQLNLSGF